MVAPEGFEPPMLTREREDLQSSDFSQFTQSAVKMVGVTEVESAIFAFVAHCSIQLSYTPSINWCGIKDLHL